MIKIALFDTKPYDRQSFDNLNNGEFKITYFESRLMEDTASLANGFDVVVPFVNDDLSKATLERIKALLLILYPDILSHHGMI